MSPKVQKSDEQWREELTPERYAVLREAATEPPGSGELVHNHEDGVYRCGGCGELLFRSEKKFDSGTGWPSFYDQEGTVEERRDPDGMRMEVVCSACEGHLGHVFNDGPEPTGLRYCINSLALSFDEPEDD